MNDKTVNTGVSDDTKQSEQKAFELSFFERISDIQAKQRTFTWSEFCEEATRPNIKDSKDGENFSPAVFDSAIRKKENAKVFSMLCFDVDNGEDLENLKTKLQKLNCKFLIHSTYSHRRLTNKNPNAIPKYRLVIPLKESVYKNEQQSLWERIPTLLGFEVDPSTKDAGRTYYCPSVANESEKAKYEIHIEENNNFFDARLWLSENPFEVKGNSKIIEPRKVDVSSFDYPIPDWIEKLKNMLLSQETTREKDGYATKCPSCGENSNTSAIVFDNGYIYCRKSNGTCKPYDMAKALGIDVGSSKPIYVKNVDTLNHSDKIKPYLNEKALCGLAGEIVRTISNDSEAPESALLTHLLTYFGNVIGSNSHFLTEGDKQGTNLFSVVVGESARGGRKGTTNGAIRYLFSQVADRMFLQEQNNGFISSWVQERVKDGGLCSGEGLVTALRDASGDDAGENDKRLLIIESEFSSVLRVKGRDGNTLTDVLRNAWDRKRLGFMRSQKSNTYFATDPHLSFIGHITEFELKELLRNVDVSNGFANRILWIYSERTKRMAFGGRKWRSEISSFIPRLVEAVKFAKDVREMKFDNEARNLYEEIYYSIDDTEQSKVAAIIARAEPQIIRLAMIYALLDCSSVIKFEHLESAKAFWDYSEMSARYIFGDNTVMLSKNEKKLYEAIVYKAVCGMEYKEVYELFGRNKKKDEILSITANLENQGLIFCVNEKWFDTKLRNYISNVKNVNTFFELMTEKPTTQKEAMATLEILAKTARKSLNYGDLEDEFVFDENAPVLNLSNPIVADDCQSCRFDFDKKQMLEVFENGGKFNIDLTHYQYDNEGNSNKVWRFFNQNVLEPERVNSTEENYKECAGFFENQTPKAEPSFLDFYPELVY